MIKLLDGVTSNTTGDWVEFTAGPRKVQATLCFAGLDGATGKVEVRYGDLSTVFTVYETTSDEIKVAEIVGNLGQDISPSPRNPVHRFELRADLSDAQSGTDATIGVT